MSLPLANGHGENTTYFDDQPNPLRMLNAMMYRKPGAMTVFPERSTQAYQHRRPPPSCMPSLRACNYRRKQRPRYIRMEPSHVRKHARNRIKRKKGKPVPEPTTILAKCNRQAPSISHAPPIVKVRHGQRSPVQTTHAQQARGDRLANLQQLLPESTRMPLRG